MAKKTKREQYVLSQTGRILIGPYMTAKGLRLMNELDDLGLKKEEYKARKAAVEAKYLKNRYAVNPEAKIVKKILHLPIHF